MEAIKAREAEADQAKIQSNAHSIKQMLRTRKLGALTDMARQVLPFQD